LEKEVKELQAELTTLRIPPPQTRLKKPEVPQLDSKIVTDFPITIFGAFVTKRFVLLCRGTRDGFNSSTFHSRCDDHANTATLILAIGSWIFLRNRSDEIFVVSTTVRNLSLF
jgi:hypothetical protein